MTPVERYRHLASYWQLVAKERAAELDEAIAERDKWRGKLAAAEIAEQLAREEP